MAPVRVRGSRVLGFRATFIDFGAQVVLCVIGLQPKGNSLSSRASPNKVQRIGSCVTLRLPGGLFMA